MPRDCAELSAQAFGIFQKLKPFFPDQPFGKTPWGSEVKIFHTCWLDLRKSEDRQKLKTLLDENQTKILLLLNELDTQIETGNFVEECGYSERCESSITTTPA